jgi:hypothetical protein
MRLCGWCFHTLFIEGRSKSRCNNVPILKPTVDEQKGAVGFDTGLKAFVDMLKMKEKLVHEVKAATAF